MKQVKIIFSGLVAVATLSVAVAMAAEPQGESGPREDFGNRDFNVWVPFDLGLWGAPQGSVPGGRRGSRGYTFRGSRRGGAGGGNLTGLLNSRRLREALELTDEQAEQLRKINVDTRKTTVQKRADLQVSRIELNELLRSENPPRAQVEQKVREITQLQGDLMQTRVDALLSARAVLTPEQQQKAQELRSQGRRGFRRGGRHSRGTSRERFRRGPSGPGGGQFHRYFNRPSPPPAPPSPPTLRDGFHPGTDSGTSGRIS